jgi:AcrR family transcriptional regulator
MKQRIAKEGAVRKLEIMDAAFSLFASTGYENTTVNAIIDQVGVSKGAFYYHFESKEDLLNAMVQLQVERVLSIVREVIGSNELGAVEKFNLIIARVQAYRQKNMTRLYKLFEFYLNEENIRYRFKLEESTIEKSLPLYTSLIQQGVDEGTFTVSEPDLAAEMIIRVIPLFRMKMALLFLEPSSGSDHRAEIKRIATFMEETLTKILGLEPGRIHIAESFIQLFGTVNR